MNLIPDEELKKQGQLNLAPMVDFLFVLIAVFAIVTVTRSALNDSEIHLVKTEKKGDQNRTSSEEYIVDLTVTKDGSYRWLTEMHNYLINDPKAIRTELLKQKQNGLLPEDTGKTKVLLHIDQGASWNSIAKLILAVKEAGFQVNPVYEIAE
jgi:biopolymer transport protein ExbD